MTDVPVKQARFEFGLTPREEAERMLAEALAGPDPAEERMPQVGDTVEMLWTHYPTRPWEPGIVHSIHDGIMVVRMTGIGPAVFWDTAVTRADARRVFTRVSTVWRWPLREEAIA